MNILIVVLFLLIYISFISKPSEALRCWQNEMISPVPINSTYTYTKPVVTKCGSSSNMCYATWEKSDDGLSNVLLLLSCFITQDPRPGHDCVYTDKCVADNRRRPHGSYFCCCTTDLCNTNVSSLDDNISVSTTTTTIAPVPAPSATAGPTKIVYVLFLVSMLLLLIIVYLLRRKKYYFCQIPDTDQHSHSVPSTPSNDKLQHVKLEETIARGKYGAIWKATYKNEVVAVKIMPAEEKSPWLTEQEVFKSYYMNHENILRFIAAEKRNAEYWILTEYHPMGSLYDYLKTHTITWEQFLRLGFTIAKGLAHLHEKIMTINRDDYKPAIAHRDFKSSNILLKNDLSACIADFDLALIFNSNRSSGDIHAQVGTRRYMAPEILEGAINFSSDSFLRIDMYAFGLVLWELASRCSSFYSDSVPPYKLPFEIEVGIHPTLEDMQEIVAHQRRRPIIEPTWFNHSGFASLCSCINECWDHDPEARVTASCVVERFIDDMKISESSSTPLLSNITTTDATNSIALEPKNGYLAV